MEADQESVPLPDEHSSWPLNPQPAEKPDYQQDGTLEVVEVVQTVQGEGPHVGRPCVFVRLAGCSLQCPLCDTDYTSHRRRVNPSVLTAEVQSLTDRGLVVLTGGEPFRQNIGPFIRMLFNTGHWVQIETNGLHYVEGVPYNHPRMQICCSPKTPGINLALMPHVSFYKYVLDAEHVDENDGLPTSVLGMSVRPARPSNLSDCHRRHQVWISPADEGNAEKNEANRWAVVESAFKYDYRISLQIHKFLGLP